MLGTYTGAESIKKAIHLFGLTILYAGFDDL